MTRRPFLLLRLTWSLATLVTAVCIALFMPVHDKTPPPDPAGTGSSGGGVFVLDVRG